MRFKRPVIVVDTETTGFPGQPGTAPYEIGAVCINEYGLEVSCFEGLCCPSVLNERMIRALSIGGTTLEEVARHQPAESLAAEFRLWLHSCQQTFGMFRLTSFNTAFDRPMLERAGLHLDGYDWAPCIMETAKPMMGEAGALSWKNRGKGYARPKLSEAAEFFSVPQQGSAHRALVDARTAALVMVAMNRRVTAAHEAV